MMILANIASSCRAYASRLLNKAEQNYDVTTCQSLSVVWALRHFCELILQYKIHVLTDHCTVTEIFKGNNFTGKLARWQLIIQEFNPTFSFTPGKANAVADALSHNNIAHVSLIIDGSTMPTAEDFKKYKCSDTSCASLLYYFESGDPSNLPKLHVNVESFFLQDDHLYKSSSASPDDINERFT